MYKRGQIGKIISTFPVLMGIFIVMAGFIALSFGARLVMSPSAMESSIPSYVTMYYTEEIDIFNSKIKIDGQLITISESFHKLRYINQNDKFAGKESYDYYVKVIDGLKEYDIYSSNSYRETGCMYFGLKDVHIQGNRQELLFLFGEKGKLDFAPVDAFTPGEYYNPFNCKGIGDDSVNLKKKMLGDLEVEYYYGECKIESKSGHDTEEFINDCFKSRRENE